jgi:hypothetical protein
MKTHTSLFVVCAFLWSACGHMAAAADTADPVRTLFDRQSESRASTYDSEWPRMSVGV